MNDSESETAAVPLGVKQAESGPAQWAWVDRGVWTDRMLAALGNGVKGHVSFAELGLFTKCRPSCKRANPDEETTDWRAVCGKTARTVRREGRPRPSLPLSGESAGWQGRARGGGAVVTPGEDPGSRLFVWVFGQK